MIDLPEGTVVVLYGRTSGGRQKKEATIETQFAELERAAAERKLAVAGRYRDDGVKNTIPLEERKDGARLLRDAENGDFEAVLIYNSSRLARDTVVFHHNRKLLGRSGVQVYYLTQDLRFDTPSERLSSGVQLLVNEYEKDNQGELMHNGRYTWAEQGYYQGGVVDYGYRLQPEGRRHKFAICEVEGPNIERLFLGTVHDRLSTVALARQFTAERIPTATMRPDNGFRGHRANLTNYVGWSPSMIAKLLRKPIYKGLRAFGVGKRRLDQVVPAIVDTDLWQAAQECLTEGRRREPGPTQHEYLLSGKVRCGLCGCVYTGRYIYTDSRSRKKNFYYEARSHMAYTQRDRRPHLCPGVVRVRQDQVEPGTWEHLLAHIMDSEGTVEQIRAQGSTQQVRLEQMREQRNQALEEKEALEEEMLQAKRGRSRLGLALTLKEAEAILAEDSAALVRLEGQISLLGDQLESLRLRENRLIRAESNLKFWASRAHETENARVRRHLVELFVDQVRVLPEDDGVHFECVFVFDPQGWIAPEGCKGGSNTREEPTSRRGCSQCMVTVRFNPRDILISRRAL